MTMSLLPRVLPFASLCLVDLHGCCWPICQSLALILPLLRLPHFLIELWSWEWVNGQLLLGLSSECSFSCSTGEQGVLPLVSACAVPWEKCAGLRAGHLPGHGTLGAARELLIGVSLNGNLILLYHWIALCNVVASHRFNIKLTYELLFWEWTILKINNALEIQLVTLHCVGLGNWMSDIFVSL